MDPVDALRHLGGVATFRELIGLTTRPEILLAVEQRRLHKPRQPLLHR